MARLPILLAVSCLGTGAAILLGRTLLQTRPVLSPSTSPRTLERLLRWDPDPGRRREAALLLHGSGAGDRESRRALLRGQGWGPDPLAAVALKLDAQDAEALQEPRQADALWRTLLRRFPSSPASADALYSLGRSRPELRQQLLQRWPAHPAALAAALEEGPAPAQRLSGALHLARWGARWPGAEERLRQACQPPAAGTTPAKAAAMAAPDAAQRGVLAAGLAQLGDGTAALACLPHGGPDGNADASRLDAAGQLTLARSLLKGEGDQPQQAQALLAGLVRRSPQAPEAEDAVRLLAQQDGPAAQAALATLPARWRDSAPVQARLALDGNDGRRAADVLRRWPDDPAAWDLQWELARRLLLAQHWQDAEVVLTRLAADRLPPALAARSRFWLGYVQRQLGQEDQATATWRSLRLHHPGGYYGWRAAVQLGEGDLRLGAGGTPAAPPAWEPLASGDRELDRLWRLGQTTEAWEAWRQARASRPPRSSAELLVEGRLRQGVGDDWTGLGQLEQAALRLPPDQCALLPVLERSLHPRRFSDAFVPVAQRQDLALPLLLGVSKQESRFTPTVHSAAGAVGLLQLMPDTAAQLAGKPVDAAALENPQRNAELGGRYLKGLLQQWKGDPLPAIASYNAGPGAVQGWVSPRLSEAPELWVEEIPFPETRLYVKKVLGNAWSYQEGRDPAC